MKYALLFIAVLFLSCSSTKNEPTRIIDLPDSVFAYKNLSTSKVNTKFYEVDSFTVYKDSTQKFKLYSLNIAQKQRIMAHLLGRDSFHLTHGYIPGFLVAKQDKIGDLTPLIFYITDEDYAVLIYALFDNNDKPVSRFILEGGQTGGPVIHGNTQIWPYKTSFIKTDTILSYILNFAYKAGDSLATVDSVSYKTVINKYGQMNTSQIDSERYMCEPKDW
jgi:hypothetical protein